MPKLFHQFKFKKSFQQSTHFKYFIRHIWPKNDYKTKTRVVGALSLLLLGKYLNIHVPILFKKLVDNLNEEKSISDSKIQLGTYPTLLLLAYGSARIGSSLFSEFRNVVFSKVSQRAIRNISLNVFRHLHSLDHSFHLKTPTGALSRNLERGTRGMSFLLTSAIFHIVPTAVELSMVCGLMASKYGLTYALATLSTMATYTGFTFATTQWRTKFRKQMNQADNDAATKVIDSLVNQENVKLFCNEAYELKRYDKDLEKYEQASLKTTSSLCLLNVGQQTIFSLALTGIMYMACSDIASLGHLTVGDLVLINGLVFQLSLPLNFLGSVYREFKQSLVDMENMFTLLNENSSIKDCNKDLICTGGSIQFKNVSFSYDNNRPILNNLNFEIKAGSRVAFVGMSGSGKSTIAKLLLRFYEKKSGEILIDGQDISFSTLKSLRKSIGFVPQDVTLFNESILYNIKYGDIDASIDNIIEASKASHIHDSIDKMPKKYDTIVGERGLMLSGGEKQRLAIARAILKGSKILILDEPTSSLDSQTERFILDSLKLKNMITTIIIAHRLTTITDVDCIFVMKDGSIAERGTHEELLEKKGLYYELWTRAKKDK
ncbi:P-loop containing nucleoside triphosphate hydrolase protein [Rozella allomycis CSF55]|uniref:Iron-sulfur clusters transporter ATM1, mitochondrial n=1 Tax=Rozella allomycis (strain CSF55) TaxID=988480 RepID=A0A4V1IZZ8_ROZAC|nr:P-loop containing nucleoside triphosphate hydrolase protein [Rozella allomycis CSF55]